jgi:hypothetical protein
MEQEWLQCELAWKYHQYPQKESAKLERNRESQTSTRMAISSLAAYNQYIWELQVRPERINGGAIIRIPAFWLISLFFMPIHKPHTIPRN